MICYLWNVLGPVLENCLHHVFIGQWCRTGTLPEDTCCLADATNVYQAASAGDGVLPATLLPQFAMQYSFQDNWVLDMSNSKGENEVPVDFDLFHVMYNNILIFWRF